MEVGSLDSCLKDLQDLEADYKALEELNRKYVGKLEEIAELQESCKQGIGHQNYRLGIIERSVKRLRKGGGDAGSIEGELARRRVHLRNMSQTLPRPSGRYLRTILGNVNVSILDAGELLRYKSEYERFKLVLSGIVFLLSAYNIARDVRLLDYVLMFLLVWYYCTLTIRESILKVNGSRIKGWWRTHHFLSTLGAAILLVWPAGEYWDDFRHQLMWFQMYTSVVQGFQFWYQSGALYRLKALGERYKMDITIEGFHSWMWRGLGFLLPVLYFGYLLQLYMAYTLYRLSRLPEAPWQTYVLSLNFLALFLGNIITTSLVLVQKLRQRRKLKKK